MKRNRSVYVIGGVILAVVAALIAAMILVPSLTQKSRMKNALQAVPNATKLTLSDPAFDNGDVLGNRGKEVLLEGEERLAVQELLAAVEASGYRRGGEEKVNARNWDLQLKVRTAEGEVLYICFAEERFYYTEGERTVFFEAKDNADYQALYQKLQALINEK